MSRKRPFGVTLLLWLVLCLSVWGVIRLLGALRLWDALNEFGARLTPPYLSVTAVGWIVVGLVLLWGLFAGKPWIRLAIPAAIFVWLLEYWIERIFFESPRENLPFALIVSVLLLAVTFAGAYDRKTRRFFTRNEEHEQPNKHKEPA
jgi:hypothetical protein